MMHHCWYAFLSRCYCRLRIGYWVDFEASTINEYLVLDWINARHISQRIFLGVDMDTISSCSSLVLAMVRATYPIHSTLTLDTLGSLRDRRSIWGLAKSQRVVE